MPTTMKYPRRKTSTSTDARARPPVHLGTDTLFAEFDENRRLREKERRILLWMIRFSQGCTALRELQLALREHASAGELKVLYDHILVQPRGVRTRALAVLFQLYGLHVDLVALFLSVYRKTVKRHLQRFRQNGAEALLNSYHSNQKKYTDPQYREAIFAILHSPPAEYGFNRTTWRRRDIHTIMKRRGLLIGKNYIDRIIHDAGYRFVKARRVLTSNDPDYRQKLDNMTRILSRLRKDERFFSIDEFGPLAVKKHGGRRLVKANERPTVPQFQKSKGCLIVTAALELSTNQITHFYSTKKDTAEMIKLLHVLLNQYRACRKLYLSWGAAGWHASKRFERELAEVNSRRHRKASRTPLVRVAPLPARAQFLNVIESVFSGLATSVIHNSDYPSVNHAKTAIDRYFAERNAHFRKHPKRAGDKIWRKERVPSRFREGQNCKNARFR